VESVLESGLRVHRTPLAGTRAITVLVVFAAGARMEHEEENGIAHFLEHLVFKGGEKYPTHRDVNATAERMGSRLSAYTGHDLVGFRITARAEAASDAIDLLTDFVGQPRLDPAELERERGVVIQEIARAADQPSTVADCLIERAAFGDHPLGRPVLGTEERLRKFGREDALGFRERCWAPALGGVFVVGELSSLPPDHLLEEMLERFPACATPGPAEPAPEGGGRVEVSERDTNQSHLRILYRPAIEFSDPEARAALTVYRTLLGGSMGSVLAEEIRERRGLAYSVYAEDHTAADYSVLLLSAGLESDKCVEAYRSMLEIVSRLGTQGPDRERFERARSYAAGRRVLAFESTNAVADYLGEQAILFGAPGEPDEAIAALDAVSHEDVVEVARQIGDPAAVACVGPHRLEDFD
jgi:predicted Zn-dependent peptidase